MKKELLEEKIKKYKEKLGALQEELEKKDSIESGDVFKVLWEMDAHRRIFGSCC